MWVEAAVVVGLELEVQVLANIDAGDIHALLVRHLQAQEVASITSAHYVSDSLALVRKLCHTVGVGEASLSVGSDGHVISVAVLHWSIGLNAINVGHTVEVVNTIFTRQEVEEVRVPGESHIVCILTLNLHSLILGNLIKFDYKESHLWSMVGVVIKEFLCFIGVALAYIGIALMIQHTVIGHKEHQVTHILAVFAGRFLAVHIELMSHTLCRKYVDTVVYHIEALHVHCQKFVNIVQRSTTICH